MRFVCILMLSGLFLSAAAQTADVIPLRSEPHHHLALHNTYVNVYQVQVKPHDSVRLHRHDYDAISVMLDGAEVTVHAPNKPDVHQDLRAAQVRLQPKGYVHQTQIDGEKLYRNVTVELLNPQTNEHNLCATVISAQPLHCESKSQGANGETTEQPQFATDQTRIALHVVNAGKKARFQGSASPALIIVLDNCVWHPASGKEKELRSGDFVWLDKEDPEGMIKSSGSTEVRLVTFKFKS